MKTYFFLVGLILSSTPTIAGTPLPPSQICIDENCEASFAPSGGIKWNPGHYMLTQLGDDQATLLKRADEVCDISALTGMQVRYYWADLEPAKDSYDLSHVEAMYRKLSSCQKHLVLQIMDRKFNSDNQTDIVPDYLMTSTYTGGLVANVTGFVARIWEPAVMDRKIALVRNICRRFDSEPYFEGITVAESVLGFGSDPPEGYSASAMLTQLKRAFKADRESCPNTLIMSYTNFFNKASDTQFKDLFDAALEYNVSVGGPDILPHRDPFGSNPVTGDGLLVGNIGGFDYRSKIAVAYAVQSPELGGKDGDFTPAQLHQHARDILRANYIFWVRKTTTPGTTWTDIVNYLSSGNRSLPTACPTTFDGCRQ